ncbi:MAG TPA: M48 family metalloprotease, partial [Terriglobales bacterium]|nr:M48 family metalloprotease [Terriglobales bacterium]
MRYFRLALLPFAVLAFFPSLVFAQDANPAPAPPVVQTSAPVSIDQVVARVIDREHFFMAQLRVLHPLGETYIQNLKDDREGADLPASDQYFLGQLDMGRGPGDHAFASKPDGSFFHPLSKLNRFYQMKFLPRGFAQMAIVDEDLQHQNYDFALVRREFLGEVRCLVLDVNPKPHTGNGRFKGRVWIEDQDYNIVRFNGTYYPHPRGSYFLHFDSWRMNLRPGLWLPAYIYSEESNLRFGFNHTLHLKAQTRMWGYDLQKFNRNDELTEIVVDAPQSVRDQTTGAQDATPVESQRLWERQAEENTIERLQKIGLVAPSGEVDKVLLTVVNNLLVTNNLEIQPEIRARVLLSSPLESFAIGHTIVISRGLLDVLPDEPSLAMVIAHELAHITLGHRVNTQFSFSDRMLFPDSETFERLDFTRSPADEEAADKKALELLSNSPYKDKLGNAGLFLKALQARALELKCLIRPHLGNGLAEGKSLRMSALLNSAPQLDMQRTDQIAALPLGARIKLDPWSSRIELVKTKPLALTSSREKMPFEVTPFFPYLTRLSNAHPE